MLCCPILNKIVYKAFGKLARKEKATADQGWFPPNRKLLEHYFFKSDRNNNDSTSDPSSLRETKHSTPDFNIFQEDGMAATVLNKMLRDQAQSEEEKRAHEKKKKRGLCCR